MRMLMLSEQKVSIVPCISKLSDSKVTYHHSQDASRASPSCASPFFSPKRMSLCHF